ncbi:MAG: YvcK family protein [Leptolyngbya sp.]|nr:YvcK family protein [Candidatus Melainabacteria bacterium]
MSVKTPSNPGSLLSAIAAMMQTYSRNGKDDKLKGRIKVALFCGGRGSASLIQELNHSSQVQLSLIVNGYDDGLSTGELRDLVPTMLGPSDFRKNLSRLLDLHSNEQYSLQQLLEYRFPKEFSEAESRAFEDYVNNPDGKHALPSPLDTMFGELQPSVRTAVVKRIKKFFAYEREHQQSLNYSDCSLGNLVFAGAYLESDDFNSSVRNLATDFGSFSELINVTRGENRTLVALKTDGQLLARESEIVGPQSRAAIAKIFLLEKALDDESKKALSEMSFDEKVAFLSERNSDVTISPDADQALRHADVIIYGPGTQFSSLLPSYLTKGLSEAIQESTASTKIFVANLDEDHDIQGLTVPHLIDKALELMGDPEGSNGLISHIICDNGSVFRSSGIHSGEATGEYYKSAKIVSGAFESPTKPGTHNGYAVVRQILNLYEADNCRATDLSSIEIYVDLRNRSQALNQVVEEFGDLPWGEQFERVQLRVNRLPEAGTKLPPYASITRSDYKGSFTDVAAFLDWISHSDAEYLVTLTGDGQYRLADILIGVQVLKLGSFGALYGSRTQSQHQFNSSLESAYEHWFLRSVGWCGAFIFSAIFSLLTGHIFSDPFTGFRIYRRSKFDQKFIEDLRRHKQLPPSKLTRLMLKDRVEIAEIPVKYRTFRGFTKPGWRIWRGLRNLFGIIN